MHSQELKMNINKSHRNEKQYAIAPVYDTNLIMFEVRYNKMNQIMIH